MEALLTTPLGRELRRCREDRNMTQAALAATAGIDRSYLSRLECGNIAAIGKPHMKTVAALIGTDELGLHRLIDLSQIEYRLPCAEVSDEHRRVGSRLEECWGMITDAQARTIAAVVDASPDEPADVEPTQFGRVIREKRLGLGLSQGAVASAAGVARSYISMVENGSELCLPESVLVPLSAFLQIDADELSDLAWTTAAHVLDTRGRSDAVRGAGLLLQARWRSIGPSTLRQIEMLCSDA
jgi:transcriptional regulator with XRE-family HTH domain